MSTAISEEERKICELLNVDETDYLKNKEEESAINIAKNHAASGMIMTDQVRRICSQMGVSEEEYMEELQRERSAVR